MADADNAPEEVRPRSIRFDVPTRFGPLRGNLGVPPGSMRLSEFAWNVMAIDERLIGLAVASEAGKGRQVSCRKGCGACCRQAVPVSPAEAWMLADLVASLPPDRKALVLARFEAARERLRDEGFGERSLTETTGKNEVAALGLDYFRLGIPCPFLEDESCSIHRDRPSSCREYLVTSPASHCADPGANPISAVPTALSLTEALSKLSARFLGTEPKVIPMTLALEWAAANREAGSVRHDASGLMAALAEILVECARPPAESEPTC